MASSVLPVPGSPLMRSGRPRTTAAFTATARSSPATYRSVPEKRALLMFGSLRGGGRASAARHLEDLHRIGAARNAGEGPLRHDDVIALVDELQLEQHVEDRRIDGFGVRLHDVERNRVDAPVERHAAARRLLAREGVDRNIGADARHPERRRTGFGERDDRAHLHVIRRVHHGHGDRLVGELEHAIVAMARAARRELELLGALDDLRHRLHGLTGYLPTALSPESMTASVPSMTAFETSETSARVGIGLWIIDSIICVAVITTLLRWRVC